MAFAFARVYAAGTPQLNATKNVPSPNVAVPAVSCGMIVRVISILSLALVSGAFAAGTVDPKAEYYRCTEAATNPKIDLKESIAACKGPAETGAPGAQYALGVLLLNTGNDEVVPEATALLEKAAASGHAAASYELAVLLARKKDPALRERTMRLLTASACGDYAQALEELKTIGVTKEQLRCPARSDADFSGQWIGKLHWTIVSKPNNTEFEMKVVIDGASVRVFAQGENGFFEVMPGKWQMTQLEQTTILTALNKGSDLDGVWIEAWDIHLLRLSADEAVINYIRAVDNRDMPASLSWKTFTVVAQGRARLTSK